MGSNGDLYRAAVTYTDHYHEMIALERVVDHTMFGKTKTVHTDRQHAKGDLLQGYKVTKCEVNTSKRAVMKYKCTVFIPVPLHEKTGVPYNEILVKHHEKLHRRLRAQLLQNKQQEANEKKALKIQRETAPKDDNIDFINQVA